MATKTFKSRLFEPSVFIMYMVNTLKLLILIDKSLITFLLNGYDLRFL